MHVQATQKMAKKMTLIEVLHNQLPRFVLRPGLHLRLRTNHTFDPTDVACGGYVESISTSCLHVFRAKPSPLNSTRRDSRHTKFHSALPTPSVLSSLYSPFLQLLYFCLWVQRRRKGRKGIEDAVQQTFVLCLHLSTFRYDYTRYLWVCRTTYAEQHDKRS